MKKNDIARDSRLSKILNLVMEFAAGNLDAKEKPSGSYDELDGIISGLNMLGEELKASTVSRDFLNNVLKTMKDGLIITDRDLIISEVNPAIESFFGFEKKVIIGKSIKEIYSDGEALFRQMSRELPGKEYSNEIETTAFCLDNIKKNVLVSISAIYNPEGQIENFIFINHDISERKRREEELRVAAVTFETREGIYITDAKANIIRVNQAFQDITGYSSEEVLGRNPRIMSSGRHNKNFYYGLWQQLSQTGTWSGEIWNRRKNGQVFPCWVTITAVKNDLLETTRYIGIFNDMTERKMAEEEIKNLAFFDPLTNLPNRRLLLDRFQLALSLSARSQLYGAVLFLDLDKFKNLNDSMGHVYGDILLLEVAKRIRDNLREVDTVARLGGDEFVILIEEISRSQELALQNIALVAEKIRSSLTTPYDLNGYEYFSSPSIGVCLYKGNDKSVVELIKSADLAMYQAKEAGRNTIRFFDPQMQKAVETHAILESNLRVALKNDELRLFFQIQVDNNSVPVGAEALIRWEDPQLGFISPSQFIPIAEESALILEIGYWVIESACIQLAIWRTEEKKRDLTLAINVSARQFAQPDFVNQVTGLIRKYQVDPSRLKLELTEHVLLTDIQNAVTKMQALKSFGVWLSIDDFGTGYSSLSYLKQLPIHQLKIDQSFVRDITVDPNDAIMVKTIISLGQNFHLNVIAEGVETEAQFNFLQNNGCMAYQGYLFGKPVPIEDFEKLISR